MAINRIKRYNHMLFTEYSIQASEIKNMNFIFALENIEKKYPEMELTAYIDVKKDAHGHFFIYYQFSGAQSLGKTLIEESYQKHFYFYPLDLNPESVF